jgi:hypothetical protein
MATLSNAQSLRVIGQELAALGVDAFNLARRDDDYSVWIANSKSAKVSTEEKTLTKEIIRMISGEDYSAPPEIPSAIHFAGLQILWRDVARQLNRKPSQEVADLNELSLLLRALGDFLDKNRADDFVIFWSKNSVKVVFGDREEDFNLLNLYNMGTRMYLKRSSRRSPR